MIVIFTNHDTMVHCLRFLAAHGLYVHLVPGRLRIELPAVKSGAAPADGIRDALINVRGVRSVRCSSVTGRALVEFDPNVIEFGQIVATLDRLHCFAGLLGGEGTRAHAVKTFAANTMLDVVSDMVLKNGLMWALGIP